MISIKKLQELFENATPEELKLTGAEFLRKKAKELNLDLSPPSWLKDLEEASEKPKEDESLDVIIRVPLKSKKRK